MESKRQTIGHFYFRTTTKYNKPAKVHCDVLMEDEVIHIKQLFLLDDTDDVSGDDSVKLLKKYKNKCLYKRESAFRIDVFCQLGLNITKVLEEYQSKKEHFKAEIKLQEDETK